MAPPSKRRPRFSLPIGAALVALAACAPVARAGAISPATPHSPGAEDSTTLYWISLIVAVVAIVAINAALLYAVRRFRAKRGAEPRQVRGGTGLQLRAGSALGVLALAIFVVSIVFTEKAREAPATGPDGLQAASGKPLEITATGQQWLWRYDYPNQAFSYYKLVVPVDTAVKLRLVSTDVVHSWFVPALGGKRDAVPNKTNEFVFRADEEGVYDGRSTVLSGPSYAAMRTAVEVVSPQRYEAFVKRLKGDIDSAQSQAIGKLTSGGLE